jgi:hypothetical protein
MAFSYDQPFRLSFDLETGGYLLYAWQYMANHGLASESCIPYGSASGNPPTCPSTCADNSTITRTAALLSSVAYGGSVTQLQNEILENGPIQVKPLAFPSSCHFKCCCNIRLRRLDSMSTTIFSGFHDSPSAFVTPFRSFVYFSTLFATFFSLRCALNLLVSYFDK